MRQRKLGIIGRVALTLDLWAYRTEEFAWKVKRFLRLSGRGR